MTEVVGTAPVASPTNVVVVLLDSLNRHMLETYGSTEFSTPNLTRLAARSVRFERHYTGSLPCMPARHDLLVGALDFPWRPWGSIEVWEDAITWQLRAAGVTTMLVSDHPHLFETGGENYHTDFTAWDYVRGHEGDPWRTRPDPSWAGAPALPALITPGPRPYDLSRTWFRAEDDFPGPRTMSAAARWLDEHAPAHDRFFLLVDEFDPHEPFDTPEPWASMYDDSWAGPKLIWPPYVRGAREKGVLDERQGRQLRANYGSKLSMIDHWLGKLLDVLDRRGLWESTVVVLCTDHGHFLGEKDIWGKPAAPVYETLGHIPLMVAWPGVAPRAEQALTTTVDIHATIAEVFGVRAEHRTHGRSLGPLVRGEASRVREWTLTGIWGREVHVTDGRTKYARAPVPGNVPLSLWSNRWTSLQAGPLGKLPPPDERAWLDRMPGSRVPVIRQPFQEGDLLPVWARVAPTSSVLFDLAEDPEENRSLVGSRLEVEAADLLRAALEEIEAPDDQYVRLGLD